MNGKSNLVAGTSGVTDYWEQKNYYKTLNNFYIIKNTFIIIIIIINKN